MLFQERTGFTFDDTTLNQNAMNPTQLNKCYWAATAAVVDFASSENSI